MQIDKMKVILGLEKEIEQFNEKIEEVKNMPKDMVYVSSEPNETAEDYIKILENSIKLREMAIHALKKL
ncbi:MAG TPA: hypothetical protein PKE39_03700 [Ignavibacteria bacterium]|nr:hypothetical protein [Ignavibacteria bacterium]HMQ98105.1 hypothetical protein [Ignavibacteria bacterium]